MGDCVLSSFKGGKNVQTGLYQLLMKSHRFKEVGASIKIHLLAKNKYGLKIVVAGVIDMLKLQTNLNGKQTQYGLARDVLAEHGFDLGGSWDYSWGVFDTVLSRNENETVYLRIPFHVLDGEVEQNDASIEFDIPYLVKHVVNMGLDKDENSLLTTTGINQFQDPLDTDAQIKQKDKWGEIGEKAIEQVVNSFEQMETNTL
jgi:hypothetical protein